jgi:hypothetical protein
MCNSEWEDAWDAFVLDEPGYAGSQGAFVAGFKAGYHAADLDYDQGYEDGQYDAMGRRDNDD